MMRSSSAQAGLNSAGDRRIDDGPPKALSLSSSDAAGPSGDLLAMIASDSPTDFPQQFIAQQGLWRAPELFGGRGQSTAPHNGAKPTGNGGQHEAKGSAAPHALPLPGAQPLPGGKVATPLHSGLSALAQTGTLPLQGHRRAAPLPAQQQPTQPQQARVQQQYTDALAKLQSAQQQQAQQEQKLKARDEEAVRLQAKLKEREDELARMGAAQQKLVKVKEADVAGLKALWQKEKEDKLAKLTTAHNKRMSAKEDEVAQLRATLTRDREKEVAKLASVHQKQLKAKDEELAQVRGKEGKEKDERIAKLSAASKELKATLALKEQESAGYRKQVSAAQRSEDELRKEVKQQTAAASKAQKEAAASKAQKDDSQAAASKSQSKESKDALLKLRGTIDEEAARLRERILKIDQTHGQDIVAKDLALERLSEQLKQALHRCADAQAAQQREREKFREVLLDSRNMAEVSMQFSGEQEEQLTAKVKQQVQDCSVEEMHWLMTRTFRTWLAQSYTECDEVCDALEAEQQRLKRISHTKEQELGKMRARAGHLKGRIGWVYQVFVLSMLASMATGCVGAWRAISTGHFWPSVQVMAVAWCARPPPSPAGAGPQPLLRCAPPPHPRSRSRAQARHTGDGHHLAFWRWRWPSAHAAAGQRDAESDSESKYDRLIHLETSMLTSVCPGAPTHDEHSACEKSSRCHSMLLAAMAM